jgi:membrane-bound serine protease (ClpP class)
VATLGLVLMVLGAALAVAEAHVVSHGALGTAAVAALGGGLGLIVAGAGAGLAVALAVALTAVAVGLVFGSLVLSRAMVARRAPVPGGPAGLIGRRGELRTVPDPVGRVFVDGALWRARVWVLDEDAELRSGDPVVVEAVDGLTLTVRRAEEWEVVP